MAQSKQLFQGANTMTLKAKNEIASSLLLMGISEKAIRSAFEEYERHNKNGYDMDTITNLIFKSEINSTAIALNNSGNDSNPSVSGHKRKASSISLPAPKRIKLSDDSNSNTSNPYPGHMTIEQAATLSEGAVIDFRDTGGRFYKASVEKKDGSNLRIHYEGWNEKWDEWIDYKTSIQLMAFVKSISERPAHRMTDLKVGDFIDVRLTLLNREWEIAEIVDLPKGSGQVQVKYHTDSKGIDFLYWVHLDDEQETAPFGTKSFGSEIDEMNHFGNKENNNRDHDEAITTDNRQSTQRGDDCKSKMIQRIQELEERVDLLNAKPAKIETLTPDELCALKNEMKRNMERVGEMEKEIRDKMYRCIVCMDKRKNVLFDGCDHVTLCGECESKSEIKKCPICRASYTNMRTIILY